MPLVPVIHRDGRLGIFDIPFRDIEDSPDQIQMQRGHFDYGGPADSRYWRRVVGPPAGDGSTEVFHRRVLAADRVPIVGSRIAQVRALAYVSALLYGYSLVGREIQATQIIHNHPAWFWSFPTTVRITQAEQSESEMFGVASSSYLDSLAALNHITRLPGETDAQLQERIVLVQSPIPASSLDRRNEEFHRELLQTQQAMLQSFRINESDIVPPSGYGSPPESNVILDRQRELREASERARNQWRAPERMVPPTEISIFVVDDPVPDTSEMIQDLSDAMRMVREERKDQKEIVNFQPGKRRLRLEE